MNAINRDGSIKIVGGQAARSQNGSRALLSPSKATLSHGKVNLSLPNIAENILNTLVEKEQLQYLLLASIVFFAGILRFYKLGAWSFWYDEIYTMRAIGVLPGTSFTDPSLSKALIYLAANALGTSEWALRLAPALIGILTVPLLYFPIKNMFGAHVALLASLLLSVSTWHLYWSQNARFYTTLLLFYTLGLICFYYGIEKDKPVYLVFFLGFTGLAVLERLFAVFIVPVVTIYLISLKFLPYDKPRGLNLRNLAILVAPSVVFGAVLGWRFLGALPGYLDGFGTVNTTPFWILAGAIFYIGLPVILMGAMGAFYKLSTSRDRAILLFSIAAIFPMLAVATLALVQYAANRYIFISLTSWILLASVAAYELQNSLKGASRFLVLGILLIMILVPLSDDVLYYEYQNGNRDNWKAAFEVIDNASKPGDLVVVSEPLMATYYLDGNVVGMESIDVQSVASGDQRAWFVEDNNVGTKYPEKLDWIEERTHLVANYDVSFSARVFKMRVYLYDPGSNPPNP